jgi:hypothetical protein
MPIQSTIVVAFWMVLSNSFDDGRMRQQGFFACEYKGA